jgi:DNA-directed RNA polymerase specialized sigma subunit
MSQISDDLNAAIDVAFDRLGRQPDETQILAAAEINEVLLQAQAEVARRRRQAVRSMRANGYTLQEIGAMVGLSHQRISQIESGWSPRKG